MPPVTPVTNLLTSVYPSLGGEITINVTPEAVAGRTATVAGCGDDDGCDDDGGGALAGHTRAVTRQLQLIH